MPKIPDVIPGNQIEAVWGNQSIRDRTVQRMTSEADRDASVPSPGDGETVWIQNINALQIWDGTQWAGQGAGTFLPLTGGVMSGPIDMGFNFVYNLPNPVNPGDAVHKAYADGFLPLTGGNLSGPLTATGDFILVGTASEVRGLLWRDTVLGQPQFLISRQEPNYLRFLSLSYNFFYLDGVSGGTVFQSSLTAPSDGSGITGAGSVRNIHYGVDIPDQLLGDDGDLFIRINATPLVTWLKRDGTWYG